MKTKYLVPIAIIMISMVFLFSNDKNKKSHQMNEDEQEVEEKILQEKSLMLAQEVVIIGSEDSTTAYSSDVSQTANAAPVEGRQQNEKVLRQFSLHMKAMAKCLGMASNQNLNEKTEPLVGHLMAQLKPVLGEVVLKTDDWSQTEFIDQGVKKRVRVDYDYPDGGMPVRRLSMYQINSYNMPELVTLSAEASDNPNEAYIASLSEGHDILIVETGARAYFGDGEELIFSQRNGQLKSLSINRGESSFNCFNLDEESSSCSCP